MPLYKGIEKLEHEGEQVQWGGARLCSDGFPNMPDGRARFSVIELPRVDVPVGRFMLTSRRGKQFNSITYGDSDPLTGGSSRSSVLLDPRDIEALGLRAGAPVWVTSDHGRMRATLRPGPCRTQHVQAFWPECNVLYPTRYDPQSGEPDYGTSVRIESTQ
jgi:anaerobic selenocysteine-containing dehydrogenase